MIYLLHFLRSVLLVNICHLVGESKYKILKYIVIIILFCINYIFYELWKFEYLHYSIIPSFLQMLVLLVYSIINFNVSIMFSISYAFIGSLSLTFFDVFMSIIYVTITKQFYNINSIWFTVRYMISVLELIIYYIYLKIRTKKYQEISFVEWIIVTSVYLISTFFGESYLAVIPYVKENFIIINYTILVFLYFSSIVLYYFLRRRQINNMRKQMIIERQTMSVEHQKEIKKIEKEIEEMEVNMVSYITSLRDKTNSKEAIDYANQVLQRLK